VVSDIVRYYVNTGEVLEPRKRQQVYRPVVSDRSRFSKIYVLEGISFLEDCLRRGQHVTYNMVVAHFKGTQRIHPLIRESPELCPPAMFTQRMISYCMRLHGGIRWGRVHKLGKAPATEEKMEVKSWRKALFFVEHSNNLERERQHEGIIVYKDESFCHQGHVSEFSLLPTDENSKIIPDVYEPIRGGQRVAISGGITIYGHLTGWLWQWVTKGENSEALRCKFGLPEGGKWEQRIAEDGSGAVEVYMPVGPYRDCAWVDKKGVEVTRYGKFTELNIDQVNTWHYHGRNCSSCKTRKFVYYRWLYLWIRWL
jgi:hypothetical protein